jgi:hypothetical protein
MDGLGPHMGEHGMQVGWIFFEKFFFKLNA